MAQVHTVAHILQRFQVAPSNTDFEERAIKALVRRLRRNQCVSHIDNLITALTKKTSKSECVTIRKSLDGRIQVDKRKAAPQVLYCTIWRWVHLKSHHEIVGICKYAAERQLDKICVNPYHYMLREDHQKLKTESPDKEPQLNILSGSDYIDSDALSTCDESECVVKLEMSSSDTMSDTDDIYDDDDDRPLDSLDLVQCQTYSPRPPKIKRCHTPPPRLIRPIATSHFTKPIRCSVISQTKEALLQEREEIWATLKYFEFDRCFGETFQAFSDKIVVGLSTFGHPRDNFEIGSITNIERNDLTRAARDDIGDGVELIWQNSHLFVRNNSSSTFFLESSLMSLESSSRIFELSKGDIQQIFSISSFSNELEKAANFGFHRVYDTRQYCSIRIHFQSPLDCYGQVSLSACWVEVNLFRPLKLLDKFLQKIKPNVVEVK